MWGTLFTLGGCCLMVLAGAAVSTAPPLILLWLVGGLCNGGDNGFNNILLARRVPENARGRAFAFYGVAVQGTAMFGYLIGGVLLEVAEPRPLIFACGLLVVAAFVVPVNRAVRRMPTEAEDGREPAADFGREVSAELATPTPAG